MKQTHPRLCRGWKNIIKMKKNLIYTVIFLLMGLFFFSSCQDMLSVDSDRVEYEYKDWSASDSVYSALGILKSVQDIADRQILLNELRGDLLTISETKAVVDIQEIANFKYSNENNKYLDVKDYYTVINNCNIYLSRVDTTLTKNGVNLMLPEYVAVKSMRAWTYLQLAINYNEIPYFTEPITTHSKALEVMQSAKLSRDEVVNKLIADILPYENPSAYPMPMWSDDGKVISFGDTDKPTKVNTKQLFVPIRMLLGEMYLWKGDYRNAAKFFYSQIAGTGTNNTARKYTDNGNYIKYSTAGGKSVNNSFSSLFAVENYSANENKIFTIIPFAASDKEGAVSDLASVFCPSDEVGTAQAIASQGLVSLSRQQKYRYIQGEPEKPTKVEYSDDYEYPGDLRIKATTCSQISKSDVLDVEYNNIITKFNLESATGYGMDYVMHSPSTMRTTYIMLQRAELAYLRLAEALAGLGRQGFDAGFVNGKASGKKVNANDLAMIILKSGPKNKYVLYKGLELKDSVVLTPKKDEEGNIVKDENGKVIYEPEQTAKLDENGKVVKDEEGKTVFVDKKETYIASYDESIDFLDFSNTTFSTNSGIHARGCGDAEYNEFYALDTLCVARYLGCVEKVKNEEGVEKEVATRKLEDKDFENYLADLILDELALELSWEGTRFGDLIRISEAMGDPDILAKRVAGRKYANTVKYRNETEAFEMDADIYNKLVTKNGWYLTLPDQAIEPAEADKK